uniref:Nuclease associated modular domain-containing protein n=1 Tax=viral metagenome TaxID=1070528 RepID=A0A6H1ZMH4_9ZZZZ
MPTGIYKRSDKIKNNLRLLRLGKILSSETKNKISIANKGGNKTSFKKGSTAWNKGIKTGIKTKGMTGKYHTEEWKKKMSERMSGEKHPQYKGGRPRCKKCGKELCYNKLKTGACAKCYHLIIPSIKGKLKPNWEGGKNRNKHSA